MNVCKCWIDSTYLEINIFKKCLGRLYKVLCEEKRVYKSQYINHLSAQGIYLRCSWPYFSSTWFHPHTLYLPSFSPSYQPALIVSTFKIPSLTSKVHVSLLLNHLSLLCFILASSSTVSSRTFLASSTGGQPLLTHALNYLLWTCHSR